MTVDYAPGLAQSHTREKITRLTQRLLVGTRMARLNHDSPRFSRISRGCYAR